jgi:hypothetical protein
VVFSPSITSLLIAVITDKLLLFSGSYTTRFKAYKRKNVGPRFILFLYLKLHVTWSCTQNSESVPLAYKWRVKFVKWGHEGSLVLRRQWTVRWQAPVNSQYDNACELCIYYYNRCYGNTIKGFSVLQFALLTVKSLPSTYCQQLTRPTFRHSL